MVDDAVGRERAAVLEQRVAHDEQVGEQLAGRRVVASGLVRPALGDAQPGVLQLERGRR